jgi:hypothetical protein
MSDVVRQATQNMGVLRLSALTDQAGIADDGRLLRLGDRSASLQVAADR